MINKWQKITAEYKNLSLSINTRIQDNYHSRRMHNIFYKWVIDLYTFLNYDILKLGSLFIEFYGKNKKIIKKCMLLDSISLKYNKNDFELLNSFLNSKNILFNIEFSEYELWH